MHRSRRSRGREKCRDDDLIDPAHAGGVLQFRKPTSESERLLDSSFRHGSLLEENSFAPKFRQSSTKKTNVLPMKTRQSPGVIARLMGLDNFPPAPRGVNKQQLNMGNHSHTASSMGTLDNSIFYEDVPHRRSTDDLPEVRDVFEVMETAKAKQPRKTEHGKIDMDFIREAFMDAKRLSTDESRHSSKEFNNALEVPETNKDLFLEFLQEPKSLFMPSPPASHIMILKPGKGSERHSDISKEAINSCRKPPTRHLSGSFDEDCSHLSCKLPKRGHRGTMAANIHPTRIVILKPSLGKAHNMEDCGIQGPYTGGVRPKFSYSSEALGHGSKSSREIARVVTRQMRKAMSRGAKREAELESNPYIGDEVDSSEAIHRSSNLYHDWTRALSPSSPSYPTASSASRGARKRLSQVFQEVTPVMKSPSTLGDMLVLSGGEAPKAAQHRMLRRKASNESSSRNDIRASSGSPRGISSYDGWKDGKFRNLARSKSLPSSGNRQESGRANAFSLPKGILCRGPGIMTDGCFSDNRWPVIRSPDSDHNRMRFCYLDEVESMLPKQEIHVSSEKACSGAIYPEHLDDAISGENHHVDSSGIPEWQDFSPHRTETAQESAAAFQKNKASASPIRGGLAIKDMLSEHPGLGLINSPRHEMESESHLSSKEGERPRPVSVLDPPSEEEASCSGCFERISADLQELRRQLRLLKMESAEADEEEADLLSTSKDDGHDNETWPSQSGEISDAFRVEEDRDFCYLLDMLTDLGVHVEENRDELLCACYFPESPVNTVVFDKLEKKYGKLVLWPRPERKLLFDVTNSILSDIVCSRMMDLRLMPVSKRAKPGSNRESFVEEVWPMVAGQRKGRNALELRWFGSESGDDMVRREAECMLLDDLLDELIEDLVIHT